MALELEFKAQSASAIDQQARAFHRATRTVSAVGSAILRYGLVLFLVGWGLYKFTPTEAEAIQPLMAHSPFLGWLTAMASPQVASDLIGVIEIALGGLLAVRRWWPGLSAIGSLGAAVEFLITLSFLFSTPGLPSDVMGFLLKDLILFGAALWTAGEALRAADASQRQS
jgi:reactive chlorine resistance protein C